MRHSTVSAAIQSCNLTLSNSALRFCALHLLHGQILYFVVEPKSKTKDLYKQACVHLSSQGMLDTHLFGLTVYLDGEYLFVDPDYKISKYAPKNWKSSTTHGLDFNGKPLLTFYFRVQFYIDNPFLIRDDVSKQHYYMQLRQNVIGRGLVYSHISEEIMYLLVGLALQADFGDYNAAKHNGKYYSLHDYFPQQMIANSNEVKLYENASVVHEANKTLSQNSAKNQFIKEASCKETFQLTHNTHLYRLKQKKQDPDPGNFWLAICTKGIELYEEKADKPISGTFYWNNIGKLCFDRKKFEIRSLNMSGDRMIYYTNSDEKSKHLLMLCRLTHQFFMGMHPRVNKLLATQPNDKKNEEDGKKCRDWGKELKLSDIRYDAANQQISIISAAAVSSGGATFNRINGFDGRNKANDVETEIMINSPPVKFAAYGIKMNGRNGDDHVRTGKNTAANAVSGPPSAAKEEEGEAIIKKNDIGFKKAVSSSSNAVVNDVKREKINFRRQKICQNLLRRHSTNSSLELGYSHTAQNSAISADSSCCLELDYLEQSAQTSSGIYTMKSSCETNADSVPMTLACSSETSGVHSAMDNAPILAGSRSRSGSIISTSGSFHGDGSDPSDTGHGTPLTAEQLSDLIVGRSPKPCRGRYPSMATVSESLDSVADYVTLPPPPLPVMKAAPHPPTGNGNVYHNGYVTPTAVILDEEAMLRRQIQFQQLAAAYSPQLLLMDTLPGQSLTPKMMPYNPPQRLVPAMGNYAKMHRSYLSMPAPAEGCEAFSKLPECLLGRLPQPYRDHKRLGGPALPVVGSNNYLDFRKSGTAFLSGIYKGRQLPSPSTMPFGGTHFTTMATANQFYQIEQYKQQLYSDVDYVIYPLKDPAISKQEYVDSKVAVAMQRHLPPPPPYRPAFRMPHALCASVPNVALPPYHSTPPLPVPCYSKCISIENLSSNYHQQRKYFPPYEASCVPLPPFSSYSIAPSYVSAAQTLKANPFNSQQCLKGRALSHDDILCYNKTELRMPDRLSKRETIQKLNPPVNHNVMCNSGSLKPRGGNSMNISMAIDKIDNTIFPGDAKENNKNIPPLKYDQNAITAAMLDIYTLREKSKNLDLPLISALCNDRSLLKQTSQRQSTLNAQPKNDKCDVKQPM